MKILIDNYPSGKTTEPMYLHRIFSMLNLEAVLWDRSTVSAYDMFDKFRPDIYITSIHTLSQDVIQYFKQVKPKTDIITNITTATQDTVDQLLSLYSENGIQNRLLYDNNFKHNYNLPASANKVDIYYGADIFIAKAQDLPYSLDGCLVVQGDMNKPQLAVATDKYSLNTYHIVSLDGSCKTADMNASVIDMKTLSQIYQKIVFVARNMGDIYCQSLLDLSLDGGIDIFTTDALEVPPELQRMIDNPKKNTCLHRAVKLLSKIGCSNEVNSLERFIKESGYE